MILDIAKGLAKEEKNIATIARFVANQKKNEVREAMQHSVTLVFPSRSPSPENSSLLDDESKPQHYKKSSKRRKGSSSSESAYWDIL